MSDKCKKCNPPSDEFMAKASLFWHIRNEVKDVGRLASIEISMIRDGIFGIIALWVTMFLLITAPLWSPFIAANNRKYYRKKLKDNAIP